jgi:hypothetical protein
LGSQRVRAEELLGSKRPITGWTTGCTATVKLPDFAWTDWARAQVGFRRWA